MRIAALTSFVLAAVACSAFDADPGPGPGASSSSSSSSSSGAGTSSSSSSSGDPGDGGRDDADADAGGPSACLSCAGTRVCDSFEREQPDSVESGWEAFSTGVVLNRPDNFNVQPAPPCGSKFRAAIGIYDAGPFAARMLARTLTGNLEKITIELEPQIVTASLQGYGGTKIGILLAVTRGDVAALTAETPQLSIVATLETFALMAQTSSADRAFEGFTLTSKVTVVIDTMAGSATIAAGVSETVTKQEIFGGAAPGSVRIWLGVGTTLNAPGLTVHYDNVRITTP